MTQSLTIPTPTALTQWTFATKAWELLQENAQELASLLEAHGATIAGIIDAIGATEFPEGRAEARFSAYSRTLMIEAHGPVEVLNTVCRIVREHGLEWMREDLSEEPKEYISLCLYEEGKGRLSPMIAAIGFSSSTCRRVQTGTELKEVPIYEIRCE